MDLHHRYRVITGLGCALLAGTLAAAVGSPTGLDGPLLDGAVMLRALGGEEEPSPERSRVVVIAVDPGSLEAPEIAAFPRAFLAPVWAAVLDGVVGAGARAVGFDLLFSYSASRFTPGYDVPFLRALATHRERVVLARSASTLPALPFLAALQNEDAALGLIELIADRDGSYRRVQAGHDTASDGALPGLAGALLRRAQAPPMPAEVLLAPRHHLERLPTYALIDVLRCAKDAPEALRPAFAGKIVLVGTTLPEEDRKRTADRYLRPPPSAGPPLHPCGLRRLGASVPEARTVPGVFLHAAAIDAVVTGRVTRTASRWAVAGLAAVAALLGAASALALSPWSAAAAVVVVAALLGLLATGALAADVWIPMALPGVALLGAPTVAYVVRYLVEERTRRRIQHAFSHYLSPTVVERLARDATALRLGGERREVTIMFADLSGFTALSGKVEPEVLTGLVNQYLDYIVTEVEATGGYVDKFIGDAVLAIWGAPADDARHAANAVRAALGAIARVREARAAAEARGERGFSVKIGMNSGPAVVGNVGTARRYNYTAIGETVNVASRLESVPGLYACSLVVGPRTAELAGEAFVMRELDWIRVKGREAPLAIFEPLGERGAATPADHGRAQRYAEGLAHYRAMRFADAGAAWDALAREEPPPNPPARMAERARELARTPPPADWDGVWVLTAK